MSDIRWEHYPVLAQSPQARTWLTIQANLGLALNTIEAYGRALEDFLVFSSRRAVSPEVANREHISLYVHDLTSRPNPRGTKVRVLDSGAGLANATLQDTAGEPLQTGIQKSEAFGRIGGTRPKESLSDEEVHDVSQSARSWLYS